MTNEMTDFKLYKDVQLLFLKMESFEERLKDLQSSLDDFKKSVYNIKREEESLLKTKENESAER